MTNKYLSKISSFNFKQYSTNQEEKRRIFKLCKRKLKVLKQTDNISVKSVLIRNTLRVMEHQNEALTLKMPVMMDTKLLTQLKPS